MKTIFTFLKPFKLHIIIAYTLTLVELAAELSFPLFLGLMIDQGVIPQNTNNIMMWGGIMLAVTIISFIAGIINSYYAAHVSTASAYNIRETLFNHIQQFTFEQLNKFPTSMEAMNAYQQMHKENPQKELYVLHTSRKEPNIMERKWVGVRS